MSIAMLKFKLKLLDFVMLVDTFLLFISVLSFSKHKLAFFEISHSLFLGLLPCASMSIPNKVGPIVFCKLAQELFLLFALCPFFSFFAQPLHRVSGSLLQYHLNITSITISITASPRTLLVPRIFCLLYQASRALLLGLLWCCGPHQG